MNVTKSPIDVFLEQRLEEDKIKLGTSLNDSLQKEMACLDLIKQSIDHCKKNIGLIDKLSSKGSISAVHNLQIKKDYLYNYPSKKYNFLENLKKIIPNE